MIGPKRYCLSCACDLTLPLVQLHHFQFYLCLITTLRVNSHSSEAILRPAVASTNSVVVLCTVLCLEYVHHDIG